jgi:hypothetical protein
MRISSRIVFVIFFLTTLCKIVYGAMALPYVYAHGSGQILSQSVGDYYLTLEYEALAIQAGTPVRLTFDIFPRNAGATPLPVYTDAWVYIKETNAAEGATAEVFAGVISKESFIPTGVSYTFPRGGPYTVHVRFENGDTSIGEASFEVVADDTPEKSLSSATLAGWTFLGAIAGAGAVYWVFRKRR